MMETFRNQTPTEINGSTIIKVKDYLLQVESDFLTGGKRKISLPESNVLQFFTADGSKISVRTSGTEPKIKFYLGTKEKLSHAADYKKVEQELDAKLASLSKALGI